MPDPVGGLCTHCNHQVSLIEPASKAVHCDSLEQANLQSAILASELEAQADEQANLENALLASEVEAAQQAGSAHGAVRFQ